MEGFPTGHACLAVAGTANQHHSSACSGSLACKSMQKCMGTVAASVDAGKPKLAIGGGSICIAEYSLRDGCFLAERSSACHSARSKGARNASKLPCETAASSVGAGKPTLPPWSGGMCIMEYAPLVAAALTKHCGAVAAAWQLRQEFLTAFARDRPAEDAGG